MQHYRLCLLNVYIACFSLLILPGAGGLAAQAPEGPQEVYTGIYLINVFDLDINRHSFYADCYLWFRWKGERDPMNIEFVNAVDKWGATVEPFYEEAQLQDDGYYYNGMRYEGRFYHPFDLERFPLDEHQLDLQIENVDYPRDSLVYVADSSAAFIREDFHLSGWEILDPSFKRHSHK